MSQELNELNRMLDSLNKQLGDIAELLAEIAAWKDSAHKQQVFDAVFSNQATLLRLSKQVTDRLTQLGL